MDKQLDKNTKEIKIKINIKIFKVALVTLTVLALFLGTGYSSYKLGHKQGYKVGFSAGENNNKNNSKNNNKNNSKNNNKNNSKNNNKTYEDGYNYGYVGAYSKYFGWWDNISEGSYIIRMKKVDPPTKTYKDTVFITETKDWKNWVNSKDEYKIDSYLKIDPNVEYFVDGNGEVYKR